MVSSAIAFAERALPEYSNLVSQNASDTIQMAGGFPDPLLFPVKEVLEAVQHLTYTQGSSLMQYDNPRGFEPLIDLVSNQLSNSDKCRMDNVLLTHGAQQGLDIISKLLLDAGDTIIVEAPSFHGALWVFKAAGASIIDVPIDEQGMKIDELEDLLHNLKEKNLRPKFIYTVPTFHNPTGYTLSLDRRHELIKLAQKYEVLVIEDIPYSELWYDQQPPPTLFELGGADTVIQLGSFSKTLCPSLRTGWIAGSTDVIRKATHFKHIADTCSSSLLQQIVYTLCKEGYLDQNITRAREMYKRKRDTLVSGLHELANDFDGVVNSVPGGGFFTWLKLSEGMSAELLKQVAAEEGVLIAPSSMFYVNGHIDNACRLTYSYPSEVDIQEGVNRLAKAIARISIQ